MDPEDHYPTISQAIWLLLLGVLLQLMLSILIIILGLIPPYSPRRHLETVALNNLAATGPALIWGLKKTRAPLREVLPLVSVSPSFLFPMGLTVIGMNILLAELDNVTRSVLPAPPWLGELLIPPGETRPSFWAATAILLLVAPFIEELLFRGVILRGFLLLYPVRKAILASAALFALFHLNPWQLLGSLCLGMVFAWWFVHTRSLLPCILGHALDNAMPLLVGGFLQLRIPGYTGARSPVVELQPPWFDLLGLLAAAMGVWLLNRMFRKADHMPRAHAQE